MTKKEKYHRNDKNKKSIIGMTKTKNVIPNEREGSFILNYYYFLDFPKASIKYLSTIFASLNIIITTN